MKSGVRQIITIICAKELTDLNFNKAVIDKISNFNKTAPNCNIHKSIIGTF